MKLIQTMKEVFCEMCGGIIEFASSMLFISLFFVGGTLPLWLIGLLGVDMPPEGQGVIGLLWLIAYAYFWARVVIKAGIKVPKHGCKHG